MWLDAIIYWAVFLLLLVKTREKELKSDFSCLIMEWEEFCFDDEVS